VNISPEMQKIIENGTVKKPKPTEQFDTTFEGSN
jgi:hypothetical protein